MTDTAHRRDRVRRMIAKRPTITIRVTRKETPGVRERLVDLLVELLDEQRRSEGG